MDYLLLRGSNDARWRGGPCESSFNERFPFSMRRRPHYCEEYKRDICETSFGDSVVLSGT